MTISKEILDELLQGVERPEDLLGDAGLMKELKIKLMERMLGADPAAQGAQAGRGIGELRRRARAQAVGVKSGFRDVDSDDILCHLRVSYACRRGPCAALYPFRPQAKTMADHTIKRSLTTKPVTIQPPPARAIIDVARAGSFFAQEPGSA